jgi:LytS/YehU family sensor histidine kinase
MLDHLIGFLRATLAASRSAEHPLHAEFERLGDYLALMQVRMGPRLTVRLELPAALAGQAVPPLLLQPLVENAIRHGLEPRPEGGHLEVSASLEGGHLRLRVRDSGVGLAPVRPDAAGFGLTQVRERLQTRYGAAATLTLEPLPLPPGGTLATITLPREHP